DDRVGRSRSHPVQCFELCGIRGVDVDFPASAASPGRTARSPTSRRATGRSARRATRTSRPGLAGAQYIGTVLVHNDLQAVGDLLSQIHVIEIRAGQRSDRKSVV